MASELGFPIVGRDGIDLVIDASGAEVCIQSGLHLVKPGGTYVQVGMGAPDIQIPMFLVLTKEIKVYGSFRYGPGD
jgi:D-xylulose reductase